jgi:hypothetical protein
MLFGYNIFIFSCYRLTSHFAVHFKLGQSDFYLVALSQQMRLFLSQNSP